MAEPGGDVVNFADQTTQHRDAARILLGADRATSPDLLMWAAGIYTIGTHAQSIVELVDGRYSEENHGGCGGGLWYDGNRAGCTVKAFGADEHPIGAWTWKQFGSFLREAVDAPLVAELRFLLRLRGDRVCEYLYNAPRDWHESPPARKQSRIWGEVERRCYSAGADAWAVARPLADPEPTDLLELLAQMAGVS